MWKLKKATYNEGGYQVMCKGDQVQFPIAAQIASGETFKIGGKSYRVVEAKNLRDENILTKVEEVKDDKPTQRRAASKLSKRDVPDQTES